MVKMRRSSFFPFRGSWKIEVRRWLKMRKRTRREKPGVRVRVPTGCVEWHHIDG